MKLMSIAIVMAILLTMIVATSSTFAWSPINGDFSWDGSIDSDCVPWCPGDEAQITDEVKTLLSNLGITAEALKAQIEQAAIDFKDFDFNAKVHSLESLDPFTYIDLTPIKDVLHFLVEQIFTELIGVREFFAMLYKLYVDNIDYTGNTVLHDRVVNALQRYYTVDLRSVKIRLAPALSQALTDGNVIYLHERPIYNFLRLGEDYNGNPFTGNHFVYHEFSHVEQCHLLGGRDHYGALWVANLLSSTVLEIDTAVKSTANWDSKWFHDRMPMEAAADKYADRVRSHRNGRSPLIWTNEFEARYSFTTPINDTHYPGLVKIYNEVLGRNLDLSGHDHYLAQLANGWSLADVRSDIAHSAESYNNLEAIYRDILEEVMPAAEYTTYANHLANGWTLALIRSEIAHSAKSQSNLEAIYQAVLGRAIDPDGQTTYTNALANGWTLAQVRNRIVSVNALLSDMIGHDVTSTSEQMLLDRLVTRHVTDCDLSCIRWEIAQSDEFLYSLEVLLQDILGRGYIHEIDGNLYMGYRGRIGQGLIENYDELRTEMATSWEAKTRLEELCQDVWGHSISQEDLDYYTFVLSIDGTLTDVYAEMEDHYFQMVMLSILITNAVL